MAAFEYGPRYSNVIAFTVATAVACAIAFFVIVSIALLSGSKEVHAPFLLTLTAVTLASGLIGAITTAGDETKKADAIAEQKGNAAFVFSNATGTFISLVASATEAYEKQSADDSTGLTYFLDTLGIADQRQMLSLYIGALCVLAVLALCLVLSSARLLNRKTEVTRAELDLVRWLSVILLVVGLAASSTWGAIPFGAKEAADIWRTLLLSGFALLGAGFLAHAISSGVGAFISMLAYGVIYLGKQLRSEGVRRQLENGVRQLLLGSVHIALWGAALWAAKLLLTQTSVLSVGVEGQFQTALDNSARAAGVVILSSAVLMTSVVLLGPIRKRLAASVAALRSLGGRSRRLIAIVAPKLIEFMSDVWTRISRVVRQLKHLRFEFPRVDFGGLMKLSFDFNFSRSAQSARTIAERFMRSVATAARQYGKPLLKVFGSRVRVFLASGSVLVLAGSLMPAAPDVPFDDYHVPLAEVPELPSDPVELEVENFVDHSPLTKIEAVPVSLCELPPGSADWAFGREDKLEAYVADCRLPYEARTGSGALVVVGISSLHGDRAEENRRAARRGQALARHAYATASDNIDIYVLNLGTAQRGNPLRKLRDLFGRASGDRPVAGLLFRPVPDNALVLGIDVADELNEYLRDRGVSDDFASCSLYQFRPAPREEDQLRPVKWFKCGRS